MFFFTWAPYLAFKRNQMSKTQPGLTEDDRVITAKVECRISRSDIMYEGDMARYLRVGLSGLKAIEAAIQRCPRRAIKTILDFPCGAGRVGRYLAARYPEARITACDLDREGVDFCSEVLGMAISSSRTVRSGVSF